MLREKYGDDITGAPLVVGSRWPRFSSNWWKDLSTIEGSVGGNWFSSRVVRRVSNGRDTSFWKARWIGDQPLVSTFPRFFNLSSLKDAKVGDLCVPIDGLVTWNFV